MTPENEISRDELALQYLDQLPYTPYPFQEEAIYTWFESQQGVLVCAPTGMGKTAVAEAGLFEALKTGKRAYYTTPLIALTEQKYVELQEAAERWGFDRSDVGLVTGNRRENVDAKILVVVAEILFNRLLASDVFAEFAQRSTPGAWRGFGASDEKVDESGESRPKITAASLNAKKSLATSWEDDAPTKKNDKTGALGELENGETVATNVPAPILPPGALSTGAALVAPEPDAPTFSFDDVSVVVMDEFHQFADPERGVVWEFTLGLLPAHIRTLLISATVGNAYEFVSWLRTTANRKLDLVQSTERKTPLVYEWVGDKLLPEHLEAMCAGSEDERFTPALVFCFNRDACWDVAEVVKGRNVIDAARQKAIAEELDNHDLSAGAGPKLRQLLLRGVGVHHAGVLPKYRRLVETLFQRKLLSFCVCTETLAAGINLPARSVVLPTLLNGPPGDKKLVDASSAHQIFGRAGRPQYDDCGYVFALAHEDDVRIERWREKYDQIPDDVKDPKLREAKKKMKKKAPTRNPREQYWSEKQFEQLRNAAPGKLSSRGPLPWRLLAHMIDASPDVKPIRTLVARRLTGAKRLEAMKKSLDQMLLTLWRGGFARLEPDPVAFGVPQTTAALEAERELRRELEALEREYKEQKRKSKPFGFGIFDESALVDPTLDDSFDPEAFAKEKARLEAPEPAPNAEANGFDFFGGADLFDSGDGSQIADASTLNALDGKALASSETPKEDEPTNENEPEAEPNANDENVAETQVDETQRLASFEQSAEALALAASYQAARAYPTKKMKTLTKLRGVNPVFGAFLLEQLGTADLAERIQAFESVLETPAPVARALRVPDQDELPPGRLATSRLDKELLQRGLASVEELVPRTEEEEREDWERRRRFAGRFEERVRVLNFASKLRRLFDFEYPGVALRTTPVWAAGELILDFRGDFNKFIIAKHLQKQEGIVFRHLLRLILLIEEFVELEPIEGDPLQWRAELQDFADKLVDCCRKIDPTSVEKTLVASKRSDLLDKN